MTTIDLPTFEPDLPLFADDGELLDALVISDLHLGSDNCQAKAAAAFLQEVLDGLHPTRRLIINGDVFDSIDFRRLKKSHWKVLSQIRHLSDKIEVIWIAGNHDGSAEIVSHLLGVRVVEEYLLGDILIIHGHQFDDFINDHPILTWLADVAYWVLQKVDRTHYVARLAKRRSKIFVRCADKIREGALRRARELGSTTAVCGHSHRAEVYEKSGVAYYNSGCWTELPTTYLAIRHGNVQLRKYEPAETLLAV
jgi:UDP-2,3-diacylglucosamine pyrophosphatase LpxH